MKKKIVLTLISLLVIGLAVFGGKYYYDSQEEKKAEEDIQKYNQQSEILLEISNSEELDINKSSSEGIFVFFGRATCIYCRELMPDIESAIDQTKQTVYYFDTEKQGDDLTKVIDKYTVEYVPYLIHIDNEDNVTVYSEEDNVIDFLNI